MHGKVRFKISNMLGWWENRVIEWCYVKFPIVDRCKMFTACNNAIDLSRLFANKPQAYMSASRFQRWCVSPLMCFECPNWRSANKGNAKALRHDKVGRSLGCICPQWRCGKIDARGIGDVKWKTVWKPYYKLNGMLNWVLNRFRCDTWELTAICSRRALR